MASDVRRVTVKALIRRGGRALLLRKVYPDGDERFTLPGGSVGARETLPRALQREYLEEIGTAVRVGELQFVYEYAKASGDRIELVFDCAVPDGHEPRIGPRPDPHQVEVAWLQVERLAWAPTLPAELGCWLAEAPAREPSHRGSASWRSEPRER